jgi:hypothetical protein
VDASKTHVATSISRAVKRLEVADVDALDLHGATIPQRAPLAAGFRVLGAVSRVS